MLRIGSGAGFSGDRFEPARHLIKYGDLDYLVLETLAERTISIAQLEKLNNPSKGYDPFLERRIKDLLPLIKKHNVRIITNMGAANPEEAAKKIIEISKQIKIPCKVAVVIGDDVLDKIDLNGLDIENQRRLLSYGTPISANAYLGVEALIPALKSDADIIITGRVADSSLFLAPQVYHYNWSLNDFQRLGQGTIIGHLLECAGQITGGYYSDMERKIVPGIERLGFPYAEIDSKGVAVISKVDGTGGIINSMTVKEQLLYEIHNPEEYVTPDVVADFSKVEIKEVGHNKVKVIGGNGRKKTDMLKVSVGYHNGYLGEAEISYGGANALKRAKMAGMIIEKRLKDIIKNLKIDYIGISSLHYQEENIKETPREIRLRVAGRHEKKQVANLICEEVEALYLNGPAAGGGVRKSIKESIRIVSTLMNRNKVESKVKLLSW